MPQDFCQLQAPLDIFALVDGGTMTTTVRLGGAGKLLWADGTVDRLTPGTTKIFSAYPDGLTTKQVDTTLLTWVLVAIKGALPLLVKEKDLANVETVLNGAFWAPLRFISGPSIEPYHIFLSRVVMDPRYNSPPIPKWNVDGTDWLYD